MMLLMPELREVIGFDRLITFVRRVIEDGVMTANDPCAPPDPREDLQTCDAYHSTGCLYYGLSYATAEGPTWGPDPEDMDW